MKIESTLIGALLLGSGAIAYASSATSQENTAQTSAAPCKVMPKGTFLYGYTDFDFDSTEGLNYNKFQGHSNTYALGADNIQLAPSVYAGLFLFRVDSFLDWQTSLVPAASSTSSQTIHNNTITAHILKRFNPNFFMDIGGGYGRNQVHTETFTDGPGELGVANYHNSNWLANINGIYHQTWDCFDFTGSAGVFYSQIDTNAYNYDVASVAVTIPVAQLINKVTMITENAEVGYQATQRIRPFVNGGLFQVVQFSNSRPIIFTPTAGVLPQLVMDQNGFRLGAGFGVQYKRVNLRVEEKYYNAGNTFVSYQTLATAQMSFDA